MKRVTLVSEVSPFEDTSFSQGLLTLIQSILKLSYEVQIITTFSDNETISFHHPRCTVLRPFQRWNWLEFVKVQGSLLHFRPNVVHIVEPFYKSKSAFHALNMLSAFVHTFLKAPLIISYFDTSFEKLNASYHKRLIQESQVVTFANPTAHHLVDCLSTNHSSWLPFYFPIHREDFSFSHSLFFKTPAVLVGSLNESFFEPLWLERLNLWLQKNPQAGLIGIDGFTHSKPLYKAHFQKKIQEHDLSDRIVVLEGLTEKEKSFFMVNAHCIFLNSTPLISWELVSTLNVAQSKNTPLIVSQQQLAHWLTESQSMLNIKTFDQGPQPHTKPFFSWEDTLSNKISRLYSTEQ